MRSAGNTRFYDDQQLRKLLNIVSLSQSGLKISQVCALSDQQINDLLNKEMDYTISGDPHFEFYISQLLSYGLAYNEFKFDALINKCVLDHGMTETYKNVIYPLLVRLGLMWRKDNICPAQEHFLSNIIRQKLYSAINELPVGGSSASSWLLFLPEDEDHDIGLLFANYILRLSGQRVIYLGGKTPFDSVKDAMQHNQIDHLMLFMTRLRPVNDASAYLDDLSDFFADKKIHLAGNTKLIHELHLNQNMDWFKSLYEFEETIKNILECQIN